MAYIEKRGKSSFRLNVVIGYDKKGKALLERKNVKAKNATEAKKLLTLFEAEILNGKYVKVDDRMTLDLFFDEWLEKHAKENLTPDTCQNYVNIIRKRILPVYGHMKLKDIKPIHIVNFVDDLKKNGKRLDGKEGSLSASSIANCHRAFNNLLSFAVKLELIKDNPAKAVKPPKVKIKKSDVYSKEEIEVLISNLEKYPLRWQVLIMLALTAGAREGEIAALEFKHIDFEKCRIQIEQSLTEVTGKGIKLKQTKNERWRYVSVPSSLLTMLKRLKVQRSQEQMIVGDMREWTSHFFIFANEFGKPIRPDSISQWWKRFTTRHKMKHIRFHELRHTSATLLINEGVHAKVISERLGHADISTTMNIYGHVLTEADQTAAQHFDSLFRKTGEK
ncbi:tyrosine-type recombinase/integrase [Mesobacillus zeae]|uniref:Site-specific integrase n=1 Tax=Mesobacillus zeae TaxID=1917180 RepID=A0A398B4R9_9BACI|nr:tyrosine-type recombinase/integrase [Mesobacillus zeae]RID85059.1 site-specific integrase [Mesobacillus zeae]